jgi:hypothetical protein
MPSSAAYDDVSEYHDAASDLKDTDSPENRELRLPDDDFYTALQRHLQLEDAQMHVNSVRRRQRSTSVPDDGAQGDSSASAVVRPGNGNGNGFDEIQFVEADIGNETPPMSHSPANPTSSHSLPMSDTAISPPVHPVLGSGVSSSRQPATSPEESVVTHFNIFDKTMDKLEKHSRAVINWWFGPDSSMLPADSNASDALIFPVVQNNWYSRSPLMCQFLSPLPSVCTAMFLSLHDYGILFCF